MECDGSLFCATRVTPSGELKHDDYDVLCDDKVGRIMAARQRPRLDAENFGGEVSP